MATEGGGKIKSKRQTADSRPYSRRQSLLGRMTNTVKDMLSPSWVIDLVNGVRKSPPKHLDHHDSELRHQEPDGEIPVRRELNRMSTEDNMMSNMANTQARSSAPSTTPSNPLVYSHGAPPAPYSSYRPQAPIPQHMMTNGDDQSDASDYSAASSLIPQPDRKDYQGEIIQMNDSHLRQLQHHMELRTMQSHNTSADVSNSSTSSAMEGSFLWSSSKPRASKPQAPAKNQTPSFNSSLLSPGKGNSSGYHQSPYYPGKTTFGGAASFRRAKIKQSPGPYEPSPTRKQVQARPLNNSSLGGVTSSTAKRILDTLERMSTPLSDAKKIPLDGNISDSVLSMTPGTYRRRRNNNTSLSQSMTEGPPTSRRTLSAFASIATNVHTVPTPRPAYQLPSVVDESQQKESEPQYPTGSTDRAGGRSGKMKRERGTHYSSKPTEEEEVEVPDLPTNFVLPVANFSMPPLGITVTASSRAAEPKPMESSALAGPQTSIITPPGFSFSSPIVKSSTADSGASVVNTQFQFSSPITVDENTSKQSLPPTSGFAFKSSSVAPKMKPPVVNFKAPVENNGGGGGFKPAAELKTGSVLDILNKKAPAELKSGSVMDVLGKPTPNGSIGGIQPASEMKFGSVMDILGKSSQATTVNEMLELSQSDHTKKLDAIIMCETEKARERTSKQQHLELKAKRHTATASKEVWEREIYSTNIGLDSDTQDVEGIPDPHPIPVAENVSDMTTQQIFFDLETTGFERDSHIVQISAISSKGSYNTYVVPRRSISPDASDVTNIECREGQVFYKDEPVDALNIRDALKGFREFVGAQPALLIGHNIKAFDCHVLLNAANACSVNIDSAIYGFLDTLSLFKTTITGLKSYTQESVFKSCFPGASYAAHNALADVEALQRLFQHACPDDETKRKCTFNTKYVMAVMQQARTKKDNLPSWRPLITGKYISKGMAERAAASGLLFKHVRLAYTKSGVEGVESVFATIGADGKPRVTASRKIIDSVIEYMAQAPASSGSSLPGLFKKSTSGWTCDTCLIPNKDDASKCVACETPKPRTKPAAAMPTSTAQVSSGSSLSGLFKKSTSGWTCDTCLIPNKDEASKCVACETPKPRAKPPPSTSTVGISPGLSHLVKSGGQWTCDACLIDNKDGATKCVACETPKPRSGPPPTTAPGITGGSSLSMFKKADSGWTCDACLVPNKADVSTCVACETAKPGAKPAEFSKTTGTNGESTVTQPFKFGNTAKKSSDWECDTCLVNNKPEANKCVACEMPRPGAKPPTGFTSAGGFSFGVPGGFGSSSGSTATSSTTGSTGGFKFGNSTTTADAKSESTKAFAPPSTGGFSFGKPSDKKEDSKEDTAKPALGGFKFGQTESAGSDDQKKTDNQAFGGFKFGGAAKTAPSENNSSDAAKPAGGFKFGQSAKTETSESKVAASTPSVNFQFGQSTDKVSSSDKPAVTAGASPFQFGVPVNKDANANVSKPLGAGGFKFSMTNTEVKNDTPAPAFQFSAKPTEASGKDAFNASKQTDAVKPVFGAPTTLDKPASSTGGFSFGNPTAAPPASGGFVFGATGPTPKAEEKPATGPVFSFGGANNADTKSTTGSSFAFMANTATKPAENANPLPTPNFNFNKSGASAAAASAASPGKRGRDDMESGSDAKKASISFNPTPSMGSGFKFGETKTATTTPATSGFTFGQANTPAFGTNSSTNNSTTGGFAGFSAGSQSTTNSVFGGPTQQTGSVFGSTTNAAPAFGSATPSPAFGAPTTTPAPSGGMNMSTPASFNFGGTGNAAPASGLFQFSANANQNNTAASAGGAGANFAFGGGAPTQPTAPAAAPAPSFNATPSFNFTGQAGTGPAPVFGFNASSGAAPGNDNPFSATGGGNNANNARRFKKAVRKLRK